MVFSDEFFCQVIFICREGRIQNMDRDPWTTSWTLMDPMDHLMDPHGPSWTTPNFEKEIAPVNFIRKFTEGQGMKNTDSYLLLTFLRVCLVKGSYFGIAAP